MSPESTDYMDQAFEDLGDARKIVSLGISKVAARSAYYAAFHAAEAYIFQKSGRAVKSHSGVRTEFYRLAKDDPNIDPALTVFLGRAYRYKEISDYRVGSGTVVTVADAEAAIAAASAFVDHIVASLPSLPSPI